MDELKKYGDVKSIRVRRSFLFNTKDDNEFDQTLFQMKEWLTKTLGVAVAA